ncbi:MAG: hypothetical protein QOE96_2275 [Blastocatellia bacterium]|jgi:ubiquinone/menaquinone biosynthesis C-methylase UbiE|nr:hypothetical protein [Blastocatellia bacterium]
MSGLSAPPELEISTLAGTYEDVASEYYDSVRHPTCANFRAGSDLLLDQWLAKHPHRGSWICEVGPGRSAVAEQLLRRGEPLDRLTLVDSSCIMLSYSMKWATHGASLVVGDATALPLGSDTFDLIVSSLGDPYNTPGFWREIQRVLRPGGQSFFTTPAYDWAVAFRSGAEDPEITSAAFDISNGQHIAVPSWIYQPNQQQNLIEAEGLRLDRVDQVPMRALSSQRLSSKLVLDRGMDAAIVTGYSVTKAPEANS